MSDKYLSPAEVAEILQLKKTTVYEMIKRGELPAARMGKQLRIRPEDLNTYMDVSSSAPGAVSAQQAPRFERYSSPASDALPGERIIIGGQGRVIDKLCDQVNRLENRSLMLCSHRGSYNALMSLYTGKLNAAVCHLWDSETGIWNLTYIHHLIPGTDVRVYHLLDRSLGLLVKKGNPKSIAADTAFTRTDLTVSNREKGSGYRVFLDQKLRQYQTVKEDLPGYDREYFSPADTATAVVLGNADYTLGSENTCCMFRDLEFLPLQTESYDLVIPSAFMEYEPYQRIVSVLTDPVFHTEVSALGIYNTENMGKRLL